MTTATRETPNPNLPGLCPGAERIPPELAAKVREFAAELSEQHAGAFQDPGMKTRVCATLRRSLPPRLRRPGPARSGQRHRLHAKLKRSWPERSTKAIWAEVYRRLIPGWDGLNRIERRAEADELHQRVSWRLYAKAQPSEETRSRCRLKTVKYEFVSKGLLCPRPFSQSGPVNRQTVLFGKSYAGVQSTALYLCGV